MCGDKGQSLHQRALGPCPPKHPSCLVGSPFAMLCSTNLSEMPTNKRGTVPVPRLPSSVQFGPGPSLLIVAQVIPLQSMSKI